MSIGSALGCCVVSGCSAAIVDGLSFVVAGMAIVVASASFGGMVVVDFGRSELSLSIIIPVSKL